MRHPGRLEQRAVEQRGPEIFRDVERRGQQHRRPAAAAHAQAATAPSSATKKSDGDERCASFGGRLRSLCPCSAARDLARHSSASSTLLMSRGRGRGISKLSRDASRARRHQHHAIAEAHRLAHVVRDEDDRLAALPSRSAGCRRRAARGSSRRARRTARPSAARCGSGASARASATRCFMPPESSWTLRVLELLEADELEDSDRRSRVRSRVGQIRAAA